MRKRWNGLLLGFLFLTMGIISSCGTGEKENRAVAIDLPEILERGKLIAILGYSPTSYFLYKGEPMGYEYELLQRLADHLGVKLEIVIENNLEKMFIRLNRGDGDIIAHSLTVTQARKKRVNFTDYLFTTRQVLVQRKPPQWRQMKLHEIERELIRNPIQLIGKTIYVKAGSSHYERLLHLMDEIGGKINIVTVDGDTTSEQLIQMVAEGKIDYTIADQHVAMINQAYFQNLDVKTPISLPQQIAWAVRKTSPQLLQAVNEWIAQMKKQDVFYVIYNKYFKNRSAFVRRVKNIYSPRKGFQISPYDSLIKKEAKLLKWDWRLLAALIYQESQFDPRVRSWNGAVGLMQITPRIARKYGVRDMYDPAQNLHAGALYLKWLDDYWRQEIPDSVERLKFVLASYNVGIGHIADARALARKFGKNPSRWEDVAYYLLRLSEERFFNDPVVQYGYCRGLEPVRYVEEILERFTQYQQLIASVNRMLPD